MYTRKLHDFCFYREMRLTDSGVKQVKEFLAPDSVKVFLASQKELT